MIARNLGVWRSVVVVAGVWALLGAGPASGHVELDLPNGGEALQAGSTYTITWHVAIQHNLENWDLWYSTSGADGPWTEIAMNLPPGDPSAGSVHVFDWTVPDDVSETIRVRVRQDNAGEDYEDLSDGDLAIVPAPPLCPADFNGDEAVGAADLAFLLANWGPCEASCVADLNGDDTIGAGDLAQLLASWGPCQ